MIVLIWLARIVVGIVVTLTLVPLSSSGAWCIRIWDFPRLQLLVACGCLLVLIVAFGTSFWTRSESNVWLVLLAASFVWHASHMGKFTPLWPCEVPGVRQQEADLNLLAINLDYENIEVEKALELIEQRKPDVVVLIEYNERWSVGLSKLRDEFPYHQEEIKEEGLGIAVWSKLPQTNLDTKYLVEERRPSLWSTLEFGSSCINLVAVHPTPPGLRDSTGEQRRDSRVRDAELIQIANVIGNRQDEAWMVVGDFNDVAWSHTTRLFKRLSGLRDPRIGRNFLGTYHADMPLFRFPIDHVFISEGFAVARLSRVHLQGSDHFGVSVMLRSPTEPIGTSPEPERDDREEADKLIEQGMLDAEQRGVATEEPNEPEMSGAKQ